MKDHRTWIRKIAGQWMVTFAIGLAVVGIVLAIRQATSFTERLMVEAQSQAGQVAERVRDQFQREITYGLWSTVGQVRRLESGSPLQLGEEFPQWLDGLYVWRNRKLAVVRADSSMDAAIHHVLNSRLPGLPPLQPGQRIVPQLITEEIDGHEVAFATMAVGRSQPFVVAARVQTEKLPDALVVPLLSPYPGLELADAGLDYTTWTQKLYTPMHDRVIKPTRGFVLEQRRAVLTQTVTYLGLTVLSLATLLAAMWIFKRTVREDMALAEMKANFVADVSHELKTPLALIHMYGETLQSGRISSEQKRQEYYAVITRESTRLNHLINNLLDFSGIDAGRRNYDMQRCDLVALVRQTYDDYRAQLDKQGFEHRFSAETQLPEVDADADAITQVIINLITNSIKYSENQRDLTIELTHDTLRGRRGVLVSVHDRGIGIRPEDRSRIFDGFFRAADQRVRGQRGAGLGLALAKNIIEAHHGHLEVESRLVKGSTFRIFLPAADQQQPITV